MMPLADAHLHVFRRGYADRYGKGWARPDELEAYEALRAVHGIARGLVIGYEGLPRYRGNNRDLAGWARSRRWMVPLAFVPAERAPTPARLARLIRDGFAGIAVYAPGPREAAAVGRWPPATLRELAARRLIVSLNATRQSLPALAPLFAALAGADVLVSHLGLPGRFSRTPSLREARAALAPLRALAALPHVGVKVSGLYAIGSPSHAYPHESVAPLLRLTAEWFGPERLYWGSDFSPALEHVSFAQTIAAIDIAGWSDREKRLVLHDNLAALLDRAGRASG
jgi:L-fuconolactonase